MSIYKASIDRPVTTILIFVAVIILGGFAYSRLPIDQFPEMDPPYVMVMTTYAGSNASEIETNVTKILENNLNSVDGLKELTSQSEDNISTITMEFEWGLNLDEVMNDIRSYLDMCEDDLPDNCSSPLIFKFTSSAMPIIQYAVTAEETYPGLEKLLNDEILPQLNRVDGIGNISLSGEPKRYIYVDIDQEKLDSYGMPLETVGTAISSNNLNLSSGTVKMGKEQYQLEVRSEYVESSEIEDIVVTTLPDGKQIYVRDLATVRDTIKDLTLDEKINSREGVRVQVTKQTGGNTVQVCEDLKAELARIEPTLPADVQIDVLYDSSEDIQNSIDSLIDSVLEALVFVVLVVLVFLGRWRPAVVISLSIPISLIVGFLYLFMVDSSLNIISLCSLTVAIGMVVDDSIVVLENITRHVDRGSGTREAAIYGTNEVWVSIIASTLVIAAVFMPLTMLTGMAGILFKELGWIVTISICTSAVVSITLVPMLCSKILKPRKVKVSASGQLIEEGEKKSWYDKTVVAFLDKVDIWYAKALAACLRHKAVTICVIVGLFLVSLVPMGLGWIGTDFMQQTDSGRISVNIELQQGVRIEETAKFMRHIENRFRELVPEIERMATTAGSDDDASVSSLFSDATNYKVEMTVVCNKKNERERTIYEIAEVMRNELAIYPEIIDYQCQPSGGMMGGGSGSTVDVEIYGYDFDLTSGYAQELKQAIAANIPGARDVTISRDDDRSELKVVVDKEKAARHGLSSATVAQYMRSRVNGYTAGYLKEDGDEYDILVRLKEENRNSIEDLEDITIPGASGELIKLSEIASIQEYWAPPKIERKSRQRMLTMSVYPYNTSLGELAMAIQAEVDRIGVPNGIVVDYGGSYEDQQETFGDIGILLALVLMLVYVVLASQFESFSKPFIILMSVPFAITGVILALLITGVSLDMIGALGVIMLVGIVVKNGIVLVDYINLMRDRGYELNEAITMSGKSRLRPVLMTSITTILGMVPMAVSSGEGSEMWKPLGIVVIGGLTVSTLVTLLIVPVLYATMSRHGERDKEGRNRENFIFMQLSDK